MSVRPTASCPFHALRARLSLMMITRGASTGYQRESERIEIPGRGHSNVGLRQIVPLWTIAIQPIRTIEVRTDRAHWKHSDGSRRCDAGQLTDGVEDALVVVND